MSRAIVQISECHFPLYYTPFAHMTSPRDVTNYSSNWGGSSFWKLVKERWTFTCFCQHGYGHLLSSRD